jgi:hypothetical protein
MRKRYTSRRLYVAEARRARNITTLMISMFKGSANAPGHDPLDQLAAAGRQGENRTLQHQIFPEAKEEARV